MKLKATLFACLLLCLATGTFGWLRPTASSKSQVDSVRHLAFAGETPREQDGFNIGLLDWGITRLADSLMKKTAYCEPDTTLVSASDEELETARLETAEYARRFNLLYRFLDWIEKRLRIKPQVKENGLPFTDSEYLRSLRESPVESTEEIRMNQIPIIKDYEGNNDEQ